MKGAPSLISNRQKTTMVLQKVHKKTTHVPWGLRESLDVVIQVGCSLLLSNGLSFAHPGKKTEDSKMNVQHSLKIATGRTAAL